MSIPLTPEQRAQKWGTVAKYGALIVGGYLFAPFVMATITGMLGLIAAGSIACVVWVALPVVESAAINMRLKMIKAEAARNPIETLQAEYLRRSLLLDERKTAIEKFGEKTLSFGDKLDGFKRDYPAEAPKYQQIFDQMNVLLTRQKQQWKEANKGLMLFDREITKAKAMWEMAIAANAAREGSGLDQDAFYAKLKTDTALDSIQDGMNSAFSQLDTLVLESDSTTSEINVTPAQAQLPAATPAIDLQPETARHHAH